MTNTEILTKAIQKAIDGGWDVDLETVLPEMLKMWSLYGLQYTGNGMLFSKDFAKALWGDEEHNAWCDSMGSGHFECTNCGGEVSDTTDRCWEYHLQQMVIAEDPIKYLGEHLDGGQ